MDSTNTISFPDMRAGILNEVIAIYRQVEQQSEYGDISTSYQEISKTRAKVNHSLGSREIQNDEIFYDYSKTFQVRFYVDVMDTDRIKYGGKFYRVISIEPDAHQQQKTILTELVNE